MRLEPRPPSSVDRDANHYTMGAGKIINFDSDFEIIVETKIVVKIEIVEMEIIVEYPNHCRNRNCRQNQNCCRNENHY